jgi:hypothetical protein
MQCIVSEHLALATLPVDPHSIAYQLQANWNDLLGNPGTLHVLLYAASVHLDLLQRRCNAMTLWHETEIIRLVKSRLNHTYAAFDDLTLAAVISLASFAVRPSFNLCI